MTPLHWAAAKGKEKIVDFLTFHEADPQAEDLLGRTPAYYANLIPNEVILDILYKATKVKMAQMNAKLQTLTAQSPKETLERSQLPRSPASPRSQEPNQQLQEASPRLGGSPKSSVQQDKNE